MAKVKNILNQELLQKEEVENPHFSPVFCGCLPNNWCGNLHYEHHFISAIKANMDIQNHIKIGGHLKLENLA